MYMRDSAYWLPITDRGVAAHLFAGRMSLKGLLPAGSELNTGWLR